MCYYFIHDDALLFQAAEIWCNTVHGGHSCTYALEYGSSKVKKMLFLLRQLSLQLICISYVTYFTKLNYPFNMQALIVTKRGVTVAKRFLFMCEKTEYN